MFKKYFLTLITFISYSLVYSEKNLFDGKSLDGWDGNPVHWSVKEGAIVGENTKENPTKGNTFLIWKGGTLGDFDLSLECKIESGNSGI